MATTTEHIASGDYESVRISVEVKRYLEEKKEYRRETLDDVLRRLLKFDKKPVAR